MVYFAAALAVFQLILLIVRFAKRTETVKENEPPVQYGETNAYVEARSHALSSRPGHLGLKNCAPDAVFAMVVESHSKEGMEMLTVNLLGEAELYRFPDMVASADLNSECRRLAIELTKLASGCIEMGKRASELTPPAMNWVNCYMLTPAETYVLELPVGWPTDPRDREWTLMQKVEAVMTALLQPQKSPNGGQQDAPMKEPPAEPVPSPAIESQERPEEEAPWPDLYLIQNGREQIISRKNADPKHWAERLNYFISQKMFLITPESMRQAGVWSTDMDALKEQLYLFWQQEEADFCRVVNAKDGQFRLQKVRLREDVTSKVIRHLVADWEYCLEEYEGAFYLSAVLHQGMDRSIRLSDGQVSEFKASGEKVIKEWANDMRQAHSRVYAEAEAEDRVAGFLGDIVPEMVIAEEDLNWGIPAQAPIPLTGVSLGGRLIVFKGALTDEECRERFDGYHSSKVYADVDALLATGDYVADRLELLGELRNPKFQQFYAGIHPDDRYRLGASIFPVLAVDGKIKHWVDSLYIHVERDGEDRLLVYPMHKEPIEMRLSSEHLRYLAMFGYGYIVQLANEIRQPESVELERAQLEGRLVAGAPASSDVGYTVLRGDGMRFDLEKLVYCNPDTLDEGTWLMSYRDFQSVAFPCAPCGNTLEIEWKQTSATYSLNSLYLDVVALFAMGAAGNFFQLIRCNACRSYYLLGLAGFEPHNGHPVVALSTVTQLRRPGIRPVHTLQAWPNYAEIDEEETVLVQMSPWRSRHYGPGLVYPEKIQVEVRFSSPWKDGKRRLTKLENAAIEYLLQDEQKVRNAVCLAVFNQLQQPQPWLHPQVDTAMELCTWIGLKRIVILPESGHDAQYLGLELELGWQPQESATVEMYLDQVLSIGFGPAAKKWKTY